MWVAVHIIALTSAIHQQLSLPLIEGEDGLGGLSPQQPGHMRRMSGSASLAERRLKGMLAVFAPAAPVGTGFLENMQKVRERMKHVGSTTTVWGYTIEIVGCTYDSRGSWRTVTISFSKNTAPSPTPVPTPPPTPHPTFAGAITLGGFPFEVAELRAGLHAQIEHVRQEVSNRIEEYMGTIGMAEISRALISPAEFVTKTVREFNLDPSLCDLDEYKTVLDAEGNLGVTDADVVQNMCKVITGDEEADCDNIRELMGFFNLPLAQVFMEMNSTAKESATTRVRQMGTTLSDLHNLKVMRHFFSRSLIQLAADGRDNLNMQSRARQQARARLPGCQDEVSSGVSGPYDPNAALVQTRDRSSVPANETALCEALCSRERTIRQDKFPKIQDFSKVLKGTAADQKKCDQACCSPDHSCHEIFYGSDNTCILFGTPGADASAFTPAGFQTVIDPEDFDGDAENYKQYVCDSPVVTRIMSGDDEVDANGNLAEDTIYRGGTTLGSLAGTTTGIEDTLHNANLKEKAKQKESLAISAAERDTVVSQLGRDEANTQIEFDGLFKTQDIQAENFMHLVQKENMELTDGYEGAYEQANVGWEMVTHAIEEHLKSEKESADVQEELFADVLSQRTQSLSLWDDLEDQELKLLGTGQNEFIKKVDEYTKEIQSQNATSLKDNENARESYVDELHGMMDTYKTTDADKLKDLTDIQQEHDEVFQREMIDDNAEAAAQTVASIDKDRDGTLLAGAAVVSGLDIIEPEMQEEEASYETTLEAADAAVDVAAEGTQKVGEAAGEENWVTSLNTKTTKATEEDLAATKVNEDDVAASLATKESQLSQTEQDAENDLTTKKDGVMEKTIEVHGFGQEVHATVLSDGSIVKNRTDHDKALLAAARQDAQKAMQGIQADGVGLQQGMKNKEQEIDLTINAALQDAQAVAQRVAQWIDAAMQPQITAENDKLMKTLNEERQVLEANAAKLRQRLLDIVYVLNARSPNTGAPADIGITEVPRMKHRMDTARQHSAQLLQKLADDLKSLENGSTGVVAFAKQALVNQQVKSARGLRDHVKKELNRVTQRNFDVASAQQQGVSTWTGKIKEVTDAGDSSAAYLSERLAGVTPELDGVAKDLSDSASSLQSSAMSLDNEGKQDLLETAHKAGISLEAITRKLHEHGHSDADKILSQTMGFMATKLEKEGHGDEAAGALHSKLKSGHAMTLADLKALAKKANRDAFDHGREAQVVISDQQALVGEAGSAAHKAKLAAEQAQRQVDALQRDAVTTANRASQSADSQYGFALGQERRAAEMNAGMISEQGGREMESALNAMGQQEHTLADGKVITADLGALAQAGVQIDAEKLNSMANMFGMTIGSITGLVTGENDRLAAEGEGMDGKVDGLTGAMSKDEQEFSAFLKEMNIDVSNLTKEEIQRLLSLKKMIDAKYLRLKNEQDEIFKDVEPMLDQAHANLHDQQKEILAMGAALQKKKSDADWWYDHIGQVTAEAQKKVVADVEQESGALVQDKDQLEEQMKDDEAQLDQVLTETAGDVPVAESNALQQMQGLDSDIDALAVRIDATLKSPAFQVLRKLRDADRFAKKAGIESNEKTLYMEDFAKQQEQYMAALLTELKDAAGSVKIEEEASQLEEAQLEERGGAKETALLGHLVGDAEKGGVGPDGITGLAGTAMSSMIGAGNASDATDAAHLASLQGEQDHAAQYMTGFITSQGEALAHLQGQFSDGGGTFAALTAQLNKVLSYHSKMVEEQEKAVAEKSRSLTSKLFDDGEWAKGLPSMKSRNQLLPAQRRYEIEQQAKKDVQNAYDGAGQAAEPNENSTSPQPEQGGAPEAGDPEAGGASTSFLQTVSKLSDVELLHNAAAVVAEGDDSVQAQLAHSRELSAMLKAVQQHQQSLGAKVQHAIKDYEQRTGHNLQAM